MGEGRGSSATTRLDIGCGARKVPGAVGLDVVCTAVTDVVCDLGRPPWPFKDNTFDEIFAYNIMEHLADTVGTMEEIHRIGRPDAALHIKTPHYAALESWEDPTHVHHFALESFDYFCGSPRHVRHYTRCAFRMLEKKLHFGGHPLALIGRLLYALSPRDYEKRWAFILRPSTLEVRMAVIKP
jgi:SAM-dependent methyltransferase